MRPSIRPASASAARYRCGHSTTTSCRAGEPRRGGEDRAGVADGDPEAEEGADLGDGGGEVDRAEHDHPRRRGERLDEDVEALAAALPVDAVVQRRVAARVEQARARRRGARRPAGPSRWCRRPGPARPRAALPRRSGGPETTVATATGCSFAIASATSPSCGNVSRSTFSTNRSMMPPQVRPDGEGVVVGDAVALQHRPPVVADLLPELVDRALDAAARHAADRLAVRADQHRRAGLARGRAVGADHGGQRRGPSRRPTSGRASPRRHARAITSSRLCQRGQAVPGQQVVKMRQGGDDPALHGRVAGLADVRVDPDEPVRQPAQPGELGAEQRGVAALPAVGEDHDDRGRRAAPRRPQRSTNAASTSPSRVPPDQSGMARPAAASACSGSRSRSSRVTRVRRVPRVNTSVDAGARRTTTCAKRSSASA